MNVLLITLVIFYTSNALLTEKAVLEEWAKFKRLHNRQYRSLETDDFRRSLFEKKLQLVEEHNERFRKGLETYKLGINKFADFTKEELYSYSNGVQPDSFFKAASIFVNASIVETSGYLPTYVNWVEKNVITPVKDQGQCGSCWAFSVTGVLEAHYNIRHRTKVSLSEQQLVDCVRASGGCRGGQMTEAYRYIYQNKGINYDIHYPYETKEGRCRYNANLPKVKITSFARLRYRDEEFMKKVVATIGPVSVSIGITNDFYYYEDGIFYSKTCPTWFRNHAVLVVGYGTENGKDYWLVKNSWGPLWGKNGYVKMARNRSNHCGIASGATYPLL